MPFGDPRPLRRLLPNLTRSGGPGQRATTASPRRSDRQSADPLKVAKIVAECLEVTPRILNPLEVRVGAHRHPNRPDDAILRVLNREDGQEYMVMVMPLPRRLPPSEDSSTSISSR